MRKAELSVSIPDKGFVLCYFVMNDPRYWEYMKTVQDSTGLDIIVLPMHTSDEEQGFLTVRDGTPYEYIWLVSNSEFVVTDSFHACVFLLIYGKEFYLMRRKRKAEDTKNDDFLNRYHLNGRQVLDATTFNRIEATYEAVYGQLEINRQESINFLKEALD